MNILNVTNRKFKLLLFLSAVSGALIFVVATLRTGQTSGSTDRKTQLIIEEYQICPEKIDTPNHIKFGDRIADKILEKREIWREIEPAQNEYSLYSNTYSLTETNKKLSQFNYKFEEIAEPTDKPSFGNPAFKFLYKNKVKIEELDSVNRITFGENRFFFFARKVWKGKDIHFEDGTVWKNIIEVRNMFIANNEIRVLGDYDRLEGTPIFIRDSLYSIVHKNSKQNTNLEQKRFGRKKKAAKMKKMELVVQKDWQDIYTIDRSKNDSRAMFIGDIQSFFAWNDKWVLETIDNIIIEGINLRKKNNYLATYNPCIINNKLFYFFENNDGKVHISYNDEKFPNTYDQIIHYECCEPGVCNPRHNSNMISFFALKGGYWYYVEAGIYK